MKLFPVLGQLVVFLALAGGMEVSTAAEPSALASRYDASDSRRDSIGSRIRASGFSGVVAIVKDGRIESAYVNRFENRESGRPITIQTRFNLASVGKLFTAVSIHQLVEKDQIALSDSVGRFLPEYANPIVRKEVTVQHLLKMQSGLGDIFEASCGSGSNEFSEHADYFCLFENDDPAFEPGSDHLYSNAGYIVLGRIIEVASGRDFYSYVDDHVFEVSGMSSTNYDAATPRKAGTAVAYKYQGFAGVPEDVEEVQGRALVPDENAARGTAAGGAYSTVGDFARFDRALRSGKLISRRSIASIFGERFADGEAGAGMAGGAPGATAYFRMRQDGRSIIALGNRNLPSAIDIVRMIEEHLD